MLSCTVSVQALLTVYYGNAHINSDLAYVTVLWGNHVSVVWQLLLQKRGLRVISLLESPADTFLCSWNS